MNIIFKDSQLFNNLKDSALFKVEFGSHLYGLNTSSSDTDILYIIAEDHQLSNSFLWEHHQLQYKENNVDHIFTTLNQFIRNLLTGDSTINFEVLHCLELKNSQLSFLYEHRHFFYNYHMIKSYLGLARRDLNQAVKDNFVNFKKLSHCYRGYISALGVLNGNFDCVYSNYQDDFTIIKQLKNSNYKGDITLLVSELEVKIDTCRNQLNQMFDEGKIFRMMEISNMGKLDTWIQDFKQQEVYVKSAQNQRLDLSIFYEVLEKGLKY